MAKVVITISDEVPGQDLSVGIEFSPAVKSSRDPKQFQEDNPRTHMAAYLAWAAIDDFMGGEPTVQAVHAPIVI